MRPVLLSTTAQTEKPRVSCARRYAASILDVARGNDAPCLEAAYGLGDPADVVRDRGHARAERAQQGAALVELRVVGEDGDGRVAEGTVGLVLRQVAEPPL